MKLVGETERKPQKKFGTTEGQSGDFKLHNFFFGEHKKHHSSVTFEKIT
jgi:hypothetical protein